MVPFQAESQKLADENDITEDAPVVTLDAFGLAVCHVVPSYSFCQISKDLEIWTILDPSEFFLTILICKISSCKIIIEA